jgi:PKD repeat protein
MGNDISDKIQLKWDFDGDGFYDTNSSNRRENYTYTKPGTYQMKVKATYK